MSSSYIALRNHTPYSLLEGSIFISTLIAKAKEYHMDTLGCADSGHLFGAMEFSLACQKKDIKPILGCRLNLHLEHPLYPKTTSAPLVLFVKNQQGYENLCHLVTATTVGQPSHLQGKITWSQLEGYGDGLMALTGGPKGVIDTYFSLGAKELAQDSFLRLQHLFPQNLYMELSRYEDGENTQCDEHTLKREDFLISLAHEHYVPLIATNAALFLAPEDYEAHDALRCIALTQYIQDENREKESPFHYFRRPQEMEALFADVPEALANTFHLAQRVDFLLCPQAPVLPSFPSDEPEDDILRRESAQGLYERLIKHFPHYKPHIDSLDFFRHYVFGETYNKPTTENLDPNHPITAYIQRLLYECDMIVHMGFSGYFLIVSDFIKWAKIQDIPVGPGRGSGAGVLVAWSLKITDVDPLRFQLFFERFLNPERISMPDFDIDFCQDRRDEVIAYVRDKYGADRVAQIITFGTLQARAVLRDVGRVLQMPYGQVDKICKLIPSNPNNPVHLDQAIIIEPQLKILAQEDPQVGKMLDIGLKLEGLYRHVSTHAAGVIIGREPLQKSLALYHDETSMLPATEFSMKYVESAGLVKFDFLGLKTLTVLHTACGLLRNRGISLDLTCIPLDDPKTFTLLTQVKTKGIFQLESGGMGEVLRQLEPSQFEELIALVALYRPGPMDEIPRYIACKHGREAISYTYPDMEPILKETFGIMVYQEQVLQIAQKIAGYSLGGADLLRRAMGKKIPEEMERQRKIFVEGAVRHCGGEPDVAGHLFDNIEKFAGYAFNKAHATTYALISYQTAYVKANYPVEFLCANLIHESHHTDKIQEFIQEAKTMNIPILSPDINKSHVEFSIDDTFLENEKNIETFSKDEKNTEEYKKDDVENNKEYTPTMAIRYGLNALKGVGTGVMEQVIQERQKNGSFQDIFDFMIRCQPLGINKKNLESLIMAGALDSLHKDRAQLMASVGVLLKLAAPLVEDVLFVMAQERPPLVSCPPWSPYEELAYERQAIGFYLQYHPLSIYGDFPFTSWKELKSKMDHMALMAQKNKEGSPLLLGGNNDEKTISPELLSKPLNSEKNIQGGDKNALAQKDIRVFLMGMVMARVEKMSRSGYKYSFVTLSDPTGTYEIILFNPRPDDDKKTNAWKKRVLDKHPGAIEGLPGFINAGGENIQTWRNWLDIGSAVCLKAHVRFSETPRLQIQEICPIESFYFPEVLNFCIPEEKIEEFLSFAKNITTGPSALRCNINIPCHKEFKTTWELGSYNITPSLRSFLWQWRCA